MNARIGIGPALLGLAALLTTGCNFTRTSSVTAPTSATGTSTASTTPTTTATATGSALMGGWTGDAAPTAAALAGTSCGDFKFTITTETSTNIFGTFTASCSGNLTLSGNISGLIDASGTSVAVTAIGVGNMPGVSNCAFTFSGTGTVEDNGYTLRIPFSGNTCLGPVSGVQVLRKPQPAAATAPTPVVFEAPAPVTPVANAHITTLRPRFTVTNAARTGPVGAVSYQINVANDEAFSSPFADWSVAEQTSQTNFDLPKDMSYTKVYYWRVRAYDSSVVGPWSRTLALQVQDAPAPTPVVVSGGQDAIDLRQAVVSGGSPTDVASWPVTARLTSLDFRSDGLAVGFTAKDGPGRWPDVVPPGWDGPIQYTVWMVVNVNGRWYTSGGVEYWYGLDRSGGAPSRFTSNWYYSAAVWGPLAQHQPSPGEQVGFFITAGDQRVKDVRAITARTNVVLVPFPSDGGAFFPF